MKMVTIAQAQKSLPKIVAKVCSTRRGVILRASNGEMVKVVPVAEATGKWKGRTVYTEEDRKLRPTPFPKEPKW